MSDLIVRITSIQEAEIEAIPEILHDDGSVESIAVENVVWAVEDGLIVSVTQDFEEPLVAAVTSVAAGSTRVTVQYDATVGEGELLITDFFLVEVAHDGTIRTRFLVREIRPRTS